MLQHFQWISIEFKDLTKFGVKVLLKDRSLTSSRPLISTVFEESGDDIEGRQQSVRETFQKTFAITLRRTVLHEEDTNTNCTVYPNEKFSTYQDCDDAFIQESYQESSPQQVYFIYLFIFYKKYIFIFILYNQSVLQLGQGRYNFLAFHNATFRVT